MLAAAHNDAEYTRIVQYLLDNGADPSLTNELGSNALMIAAENGNLDIVKAFDDMYNRKNKGQVWGFCKTPWIRCKNKNDQTALMLEAEKSQGHIASYIITNYPEELIVQNVWKKNVFLLCCEYGVFGIAQWILNHIKGANESIKMKDKTVKQLVKLLQRDYDDYNMRTEMKVYASRKEKDGASFELTNSANTVVSYYSISFYNDI